MRKNLLVTTALVAVAFSTQAFAENKVIESFSNKTSGEAIVMISNGTTATANNITVSNNSNNDGGMGGAICIGKATGTLNVTGGTFAKNSSIYDGGAIGNYGILSVDGTEFFQNKSQTTEKDSQPIGGGAISLGTDSQTTITNSTFKENETGFNGGAIATRRTLQPNEKPTGNLAENGNFLKISNSEFIENKALGTTKDTKNGQKSGGYGGAIANTFETAEISGSTFTENEAKNGGGAVYLTGFINDDAKGTATGKGGVLSISNSIFSSNRSDQGGAILSGTSAKKLTIANTDFTGNIAVSGGGAVWSGAETNITGGKFEGNKVTGQTYGANNSSDSGTGVSEGGAAIFVGSSSKTTINGSTFIDNDSGTVGGAIATRLSGDNTNLELTIKDAAFERNKAKISGGAINIAKNDTNVTFDGVNTFSGNKAGDDLNDIHNAGSITVAKGSTLTLDGGISGEGTTAFAEDTTLNVKQGVTTIANKVTSEGTTLNIALKAGTDKIELNDIFKGNADDKGLYKNITLGGNALYNFVAQDEDTSLYKAEQKSASEVASSLGVSASAASAVMAAVSGGETASNDSFNEIVNTLNDAAQAGDSAAAAEAEKLGADAAPVARSVETSRTNMVFAAVNDELNGAGNAMAEGMSAGDYFRKAKAWIRGLFNYADYDGTSKAQGFDADTYGVAMGIDKELDNHVKAGFGYAYSQTDVNGDSRDTDVDSHTLFVYGQYKPADWYVNTTLAYSWSDYEEKKSVLGYNANAKYDVDTIAAQAMYGFERKLGEYDLNPEFGFRYMHISQDGYTDNLGSKVKSKDSDVLTAVAGTKVAKSYELDNGLVLRPELKAAVTYDIVSDNNNANVVLANGAGYRVNGEKLERLGFEFGAKVATDVSDNWELAAGYELRLRKDYSDNTLMLNAKYKF